MPRAQSVGERAHLFAAVSTGKYLAMSERVGSIAAGFAGVQSIKPLLTIQEGKLDLLERVRTQKKAWARVVELAEQAANGKPIERMGIVHVAAPQAAQKFKQPLRAALNCPTDILVSDLTPGLSAHTGSGLVGVAIVVEQ